MAAPRPPRPPALDPIGVPELDPALDPVGDPERDPPPPISQGGADLAENRDPVGGSVSSPGYISPRGDLLPEHRLATDSMSEASKVPEEDILEMLARPNFTSGGGPTLFQKFAYWLSDYVESDNVFVDWVVNRSGIHKGSGSGGGGGSGPVARRVLLSLGRIQPSAAQIQKQLSQILKSVKTIEEQSVEGVEVLKEIKGLSTKTGSIVKSVEEVAGTEVEDSIVAEMVSNLKNINKSDVSKVVKEMEILANNVAFPFSIRETFNKMKTEILVLATLVDGLADKLVKPTQEPADSATPAADPAKPAADPAKLAADPVKPAADPAKPAAESAKPAAEPAKPAAEPAKPAEPAAGPAKPAAWCDKPAVEQSQLKPAFGPIPFPHVGKLAKDVLYKGFDLQPMHGEVACKLGQTSNDLSVLLKISSTPSVKSIISQNQLWGTDFKGAFSLQLPFVSNTSKAKLRFMHDRLSVNASFGLHTDPDIKIAAMVGSSFFSGGGRLGFNTKQGSVTDIDIAASVNDPELGTFSSVFNLVKDGQVDPKHGAYRALYSKIHNNTYAAELEYKFVEEKDKDPKHVIVASAGVLHQHDSRTTFKAKICSTGHASGMIECGSQGPAHSRLRASVQVDLLHLDRPPRVGFSISAGQTK